MRETPEEYNTPKTISLDGSLERRVESINRILHLDITLVIMGNLVMLKQDNTNLVSIRGNYSGILWNALLTFTKGYMLGKGWSKSYQDRLWKAIVAEDNKQLKEGITPSPTILPPTNEGLERIKALSRLTAREIGLQPSQVRLIEGPFSLLKNGRTYPKNWYEFLPPSPRNQFE